MKLSLAWIFDHLQADWHTIDKEELVRTLNTTTAEVEAAQPIEIPLDLLAPVKVVVIAVNSITVLSPEHCCEYILPLRIDAKEGDWFLIYIQTDNVVRWANAQDLGCIKNDTFPAIAIDNENELSWREGCEAYDYILHVDNKSITHRPDLWGHRGFAREIGAILKIPLRLFETFLSNVQMERLDRQALSIKTDACSTLATASFTYRYKPSTVWMMLRLARIDMKSHDTLVDATNYVMLDLGHPIHAFDARSVPAESLMVRMAQTNETIRLLDGQRIELSPEDIVVANMHDPISLAGIMGSLDSNIRPSTTQVVMEASCFDATTIRKSAIQHKKRTEAAIRFEKGLDQQMPPYALSRLIALLDQCKATYQMTSSIVTCSKDFQPTCLELKHDMIQNRLGIVIEPTFVIDTLQSLGFNIKETESEANKRYKVIVPSFRAAKDITIVQDLIEEIGRFYGYGSILPLLPRITASPFISGTMRATRTIKRRLAFDMAMKELENYAFFDERFLELIQFEPPVVASVMQPVSENWSRIVTDLVPHLIHAVVSNGATNDQLRFFEWNNVWEKTDASLIEKKMLAGILFEKKGKLDFYEGKKVLSGLTAHLSADITFTQIQQPNKPWYAPHQTAFLLADGKQIGCAGMADPVFWQRLCHGKAFIFELDAKAIIELMQPLKQFQSICPYPDVIRDISMLVALSTTAQSIISRIITLDKRIVKATLIDFYESKEWKEQRAITIRITMRNVHATMTTQEIDELYLTITSMLEHSGALIR